MLKRPIAYLTRRDHFSASHRLYTNRLSEEENEKVYAKCAGVNGHGHNYYIQITVRGPVDPVTGMVMNLQDLKTALAEAVIEPLDHKCIDKDVPYFQQGVVSTTENIAIFAWDQLQKILPNPKLLFEVKIWETEKNIVAYRGECENVTDIGDTPRNGLEEVSD